MLPKFAYIRPKTLAETLDYLKDGHNHKLVVAGGTDLLVRIRAKGIRPETLIDVKDLPELKEIRETPGGVFIGGAVTFSDIIESSIINRDFPLLRQAAQLFGSPQIRNLATIGGNVQTASPAGDGLVALFGLQARVALISVEKERLVPIEDFVKGPQETCKEPPELLKGFQIEKRSWHFQRFFKIGRRNAVAISVVNGVINLNFAAENRKIREAQIVLGAVAPTPVRLKIAEGLLTGKIYTKVLGQELQALVKKSIDPISDVRASKEYRAYIAGVICDRIVCGAAKEGGAGE